MGHLDAQTLSSALRGEPEALLAVRDHLGHPCERCEELLEGADLGLVEGVLDQVLLGLAPPKDSGFDEVGFARIRRAVRAPSGRVWAVSGMAASLLFAVWFGRPQGTFEQDTKGGPLVTLEMEVAAREPGGRVHRLEDRAHVSSDEVVLIRYHATEHSQAMLLRQGVGAEAEPLGVFTLEPGTHDLGSEDQVMGVSLQGDSGTLRLWLAATLGNSALDLATARRALRGDSPGVAVVGFTILVETGHRPALP